MSNLGVLTYERQLNDKKEKLMEDVIWFLVNYPVFLLLVMNICAYWKRDRVTEALAKVIDSRKRIKIDIVDIVCIAGTISGLFGFF